MEKDSSKVMVSSERIITQESIDKSVVKFVIKSMSPVSIVENKHFRELLLSENFLMIDFCFCFEM